MLHTDFAPPFARAAHKYESAANRPEKDQCDHGKFPIHHEEDSDCANNRDWLLKKIAANTSQSHLHGARVIGDTRH